MDDDCEEIYAGGLLKRYCKHPAELKHLHGMIVLEKHM